MPTIQTPRTYIANRVKTNWFLTCPQRISLSVPQSTGVRRHSKGSTDVQSTVYTCECNRRSPDVRRRQELVNNPTKTGPDPATAYATSRPVWVVTRARLVINKPARVRWAVGSHGSVNSRGLRRVNRAPLKRVQMAASDCLCQSQAAICEDHSRGRSRRYTRSSRLMESYLKARQRQTEAASWIFTKHYYVQMCAAVRLLLRQDLTGSSK